MAISLSSDTIRSLQLSVRRLADGLERRGPVLARGLILFYATALALLVASGLRTPRGWEVASVAKGLLAGAGYAFPAGEAWLGPWPGRDWVATAWTDPLYTFLYAGLRWAFAARADMLATLLSVAAAAAFLWLLARTVEERIGARFSLPVTLLAVGTLQTEVLGVHPGTIVAFAVLVLLRRLLEPAGGLRAAAANGLLAGLTVLLWSALLPLLPVLAGLEGWRRARGWRAPVAGGVFLAVALATVAPWTLRNALVFGDFVPVRTGGGQIVHLGTVGLGATLDPDSAPLPPPWRAQSALAAVRAVIHEPLSRRGTLEAWQHEVLLRAGPPGLDEAERDRFLMREALAWIFAHPLTAAGLGAARLLAFVLQVPGYGDTAWSRIPGMLATALALSALVLLPWRRDSPLPVLALPLLGYAGLFLLVTPYYYRYRMLVEPCVLLLAALALYSLAERTDQAGRRRP